jgi:hypothetical protein
VRVQEVRVAIRCGYGPVRSSTPAMSVTRRTPRARPTKNRASESGILASHRKGWFRGQSHQGSFSCSFGVGKVGSVVFIRGQHEQSRWSRSSAHSPHFGEAAYPEVAQCQKFGVTGRLHVAEAAVAPAD